MNDTKKQEETIIPEPQHIKALMTEPKRKVRSYQDIWQEHNPYTPPSREEIEQEIRRQKSRGVISAIGDGISALSNLFFTTQGAPNVDQSGYQLSTRNRAIWDKLQADREARKEQWRKGYERALLLDREAEEKEAEGKRKLAIAYDKQIADNHKSEEESRLKWAEVLRKGHKDKSDSDLALRRANEDARHNRAQEGISYGNLAVARQNANTNQKRFAGNKDKDAYPIAFGNGKVMHIPSKNLSAATIARLRANLSKEAQDRLFAIEKGYRGKQVRLTNDDIMKEVGKEAGTNPALVREVLDLITPNSKRTQAKAKNKNPLAIKVTPTEKLDW